jgi:competence protein ComEA
MGWLTPAERRAVVLVAMLFALGAGRDLWRVHHPRELPRPMSKSEHSFEAPPPPAHDSGSGNPAPTPGVPNDASGRSPGGTVSNSIIDLNRASIEELDRLPGVGPVLARRIVEHRQREGRFREVDELLAVRGIGPRLLERLRGHVRVEAR